MSQANGDVKPLDPSSAPSTEAAPPPTEQLAPGEADALREQGARTPRPYRRDGVEVHQDHRSSSVERRLSGGHVATSQGRPAAHEPSSGEGDGAKGLASSTEAENSVRRPPYRRRRTTQQLGEGEESVDGSGSGTEADDERPASGFVRALPAATLRPSKGLKTGEQNEDALLTPSQLDDEGRRLPEGGSNSYFLRQGDKRDPAPATPALTASEQRAEQDKLLRRRFAEFLRRSCEVALAGVIVGCVLCGAGVWRTAVAWRWELISYGIAIAALVLAYPVKLSIVVDRRHARSRKLWQRFRVPASFDPATVLYPPLLPVLVALSIAPAYGAVVMPNIVLGLSSLPQRLFPRSSRLGGFNAVHWFVAIIPLIVSENTTYISKITPPMPYLLKSGPPGGLSSETLVCLYPLHQALLQPLHYLTTSSLLITELHLLSVGLINLSLLSESPQAVILKACLWIGGISLFVTCRSLLNWNLTLARVPRWKLRRPGILSKERRSMVDAVTQLINFRQAVSVFFRAAADVIDSDADEDEPSVSIKRKAIGAMPRLTTAGLMFHSLADKVEPKSAIEPRQLSSTTTASEATGPAPRRRRNTVPEREAPLIQGRQTSRRKGRKSLHLPWYLQLTPEEATQRKWLYAGLTYLVILVLVLGPVRIYVANDALHAREPIQWAFFYLFGQFHERDDRMLTLAWLEPTISYIPPWDLNPIRIVFGTANLRLVIIAYWALVLAAGLLTVFSLTAVVEVDTRRKVFHGVMVAMFVPSLYFDPCFCALALALALAAFLLLEVLRAAQVPPLGNAISRFVAPYVDGRDLRGPVVVSHIFLLVGCAVPLWCSLACFARAGVAPWQGWEVAGNFRETAMLAGIVCVGLGDAAASLIGRRYGRHKWPWVGGKSFEGSAAFAVAVTGGLLVCKWWLINCGWKDVGQPARIDQGVRVFLVEWGWVLLKAVFCACSASFMEAVLTGANDNVVVPIVLWLLVKGVRM